MRLSTITPIKALALLAGLAVFAAMTGCSQAPPEQQAVFWVIAGTNRGEGFSRNSLAGYDLTGRQVAGHGLPKYHIGGGALDSRGRLWLGQAWNDQANCNLLQVWQDGKLAARVEVGQRPEAGIVEFNGEILAGCALSGFEFSLWAVDPVTEAAREVAQVHKGPGDFLLLTAIAATKDYLVAAAIHNDPQDASESRTSIWWYDKDYTPMGSLDLGPDTAVWSILPRADGQFVLLNNSAFIREQPDLLIFDPAVGEISGTLQGAGFPYRGVNHDGRLFILNRIWSSTRINSQRSVTIVDGDVVTTIALPDNLGAVDIAAAGDKVYLAVWERGSSAGDGIYALDPMTGDLEQIIDHPDASTILIVQN